MPAALHDLSRVATGSTTVRRTMMGKGNKQGGNREAKTPKDDKEVGPVSSTFLRPQADAGRPGAKPSSK